MIREATAADTFRLVEMTTRFLLTTRYGALFAPDPERIAALVALVLEHGVILVAEEPVPEVPETCLVGMIAMTLMPHLLNGQPCAEEQAWWVEPEFRHGLIGPRLLKAAEGWARRNRAKMIKMIAPEGSAVGEFYRLSGYEAVETSWVKVL